MGTALNVCRFVGFPGRGGHISHLDIGGYSQVGVSFDGQVQRACPYMTTFPRLAGIEINAFLRVCRLSHMDEGGFSLKGRFA